MTSDLDEVIRQAFLNTHEGYSTDRVIVDDALNPQFVAEVQRLKPGISALEANWHLLDMRKNNRLGRVATKRSNYRHEDYQIGSQIAARLMEDKYNVTTDRVFCDPFRRREFDGIAQNIRPTTSTLRLRLGALCLRKLKQLKPEQFKRLVAGVHYTTFEASELLKNPRSLPAEPGVYAIRDHSGYLYIGEAQNLSHRIAQHLDHSDRKALARYFWSDGLENVAIDAYTFNVPEAKRAQWRRAYEAELIRSRNPRFNIQSAPNRNEGAFDKQ